MESSFNISYPQQGNVQFYIQQPNIERPVYVTNQMAFPYPYGAPIQSYPTYLTPPTQAIVAPSVPVPPVQIVPVTTQAPTVGVTTPPGASFVSITDDRLKGYRRGILYGNVNVTKISVNESNSHIKSVKTEIDSEEEGDLVIDETNEGFSSGEASTSIDLSMSMSSTSTHEDEKWQVREIVIEITPKDFQRNLCPELSSITTEIPALSRTYKKKIKYNEKMARQFPTTKVRSEEEQKLREKNTIAAQISRAKNNATYEVVDDVLKKTVETNVALKKEVAARRAYADKLLKLIGQKGTNWRLAFDAYRTEQELKMMQEEPEYKKQKLEQTNDLFTDVDTMHNIKYHE